MMANAATENALRWKLTTIERKLRSTTEALTAAESERDALKAAGSAMGVKLDQRDVEVEQLRADIVDTRSQWAARTKRLQERVSHMGFLEESIADIMVELTDRSVEKTAVDSLHPTANATRDKFLAQVKADHVVAVEQLQTLIRMHLAFRDDFQHELRKAVDVAVADHSRQLQEAHSKIDALEAGRAVLKKTLKRYQVMAADADAARAAVVAESKTDVAKVRDEGRHIATELQQARLKIDVLEGALRGNAASGGSGGSSGGGGGGGGGTTGGAAGRQDGNSIRVMELEEALAQAKHKAQLAARKQQNAHALEVKELSDKLDRLTPLAQERDSLRNELDAARDTIKALRNNHVYRKHQQAEAKVQQLQLRLRDTAKGLDAAKAQAHKAKQLARVKQDKMDRMRKEYTRFNKLLLEEQQEEPRTVPTAPEDLAALAAGNSHYAEFYRQRLRKKEQEAAALTKRVRKLLVTQTQQVAVIGQLESKVDTQVREIKTLQQKADDAARRLRYQQPVNPKGGRAAAPAASAAAPAVSYHTPSQVAATSHRRRRASASVATGGASTTAYSDTRGNVVVDDCSSSSDVSGSTSNDNSTHNAPDVEQPARAPASAAAPPVRRKRRPHSAVPLRRRRPSSGTTTGSTRGAAAGVRRRPPSAYPVLSTLPSRAPSCTVAQPDGGHGWTVEAAVANQAPGDADKQAELMHAQQLLQQQQANEHEFCAALAAVGVDNDDSDEGSDSDSGLDIDNDDNDDDGDYDDGGHRGVGVLDDLAGIRVLRPSERSATAGTADKFSVRMPRDGPTRASSGVAPPVAPQAAHTSSTTSLLQGTRQRHRPHSAVARISTRSKGSRSAPHLSFVLESVDDNLPGESEIHDDDTAVDTLLAAAAAASEQTASQRAFTAAQQAMDAAKGVQARLAQHKARLGTGTGMGNGAGTGTGTGGATTSRANAGRENAVPSGSASAAIRARRRPQSAVTRPRRRPPVTGTFR